MVDEHQVSLGVSSHAARIEPSDTEHVRRRRMAEVWWLGGVVRVWWAF
jgi:hypothetical protein